MKVCAKICNECPFRKDAPKGWLGPHTVEELLDAQQFEFPFSCHKLREDDSTEADIIQGRLKICRGFVASASASFKLFGQHPIYGKALRTLQDTITDEDKELVLDRRGFAAHHDI
jgi:hypothetical protein